MYRIKKARRKLNMQPFLIGGGVLVVAGIILLIALGSPKMVMAEKGQLTYTGDFSSVIIRDERVYETENYEKAVFIAAEGQKVKKGEDIAQVFNWEYNDTVFNQLLQKQNEIMNYQVNDKLKDINNKVLAEYNDNINSLSNNIHDVITGVKDGDIITLERSLKEQMTKRKDYLTDEAVRADDHLEEMYQEEKTLLDRIAEWQMDIKADADGIVSFYFDGNEQYLNIQNMEKLNKKDIDEILAGKTSKLTEADNKAARPFFRLVNAQKWYVATYSDQKVAEFFKNTSYTLTFKDIYNKKYTGKLVDERKDTRGYIYTFQMSDDVSALLRIRKMEVKIENTFTGIKVPESAVKEKDGTYGVYVQDSENGVSKFEPVNVLIRKDKSAVVKPMGLQFSAEGKYRGGILMAGDYDYIRHNLEYIQERVGECASRTGRTLEDITLVAVTKTIDPARIQAAGRFWRL